MAAYSIEKKVKLDSNGEEVSTTWDIYDGTGELLRSGIKSKNEAIELVKSLEEKDYLEEESKNIQINNGNYGLK